MQTVGNSIKPGEWIPLKEAGGDDTLPTDLSTKPTVAKDVSGLQSGPNGITFYADFDASGGSAVIHWYGGLSGSNTVIPIGTSKVSGTFQAGASLYRSVLTNIDMFNLGWIAAYVQELTTATTVAIYGAPV